MPMPTLPVASMMKAVEVAPDEVVEAARNRGNLGVVVPSMERIAAGEVVPIPSRPPIVPSAL